MQSLIGTLKYALFCGAALALGVAPVASAWDTVYQRGLVDETVSGMGDFDVSANGTAWMSNYNATYRVLPGAPPQLQHLVQSFDGVILALDDGGAVQRDSKGVTRFGADGRFQWSRPLDPQLVPAWIAANQDGSVWTFDYYDLVRIGTDGSILARVPFHFADYLTHNAPLANDPADGALYTATLDSGVTLVNKLDRYGKPLWSITAPGLVDVLHLAPDRGVMVAGRGKGSNSLYTAPQITRLDAAGNTRYSRLIGARESDRVENLVAGEDGEAYVLSQELDHCYQRQLLHLDASGQLKWVYELPFQPLCSIDYIYHAPRVFLAASASGGVNVAAAPATLFVHLSQAGEVLAQAPLDITLGPKQLADRSYVGYQFIQGKQVISHFDEMGAALPSPYPPTLLPQPGAPLAATIDSAGNSYFVEGRPAHRLVSVRPQGTLNWATDLPFDGPLSSAALSVGGDAVCMTGKILTPSPRAFSYGQYPPQIQCFSRSDGGMRWKHAYNSAEPQEDVNQADGARLLDNGRLVAGYAVGDGYHMSVYFPDGSQQRDTVVSGRFDKLTINATGQIAAAVRFADNVPAYVLYRADASQAFNVRQEVKLRSDLLLDEAGNLYVAGPSRTQPTVFQVTSLSPMGATRWTHDLPGDGASHLVLNGDQLIVTQSDDATTHVGAALHQHALSLSSSSGVESWRHTFDGFRDVPAQISLGDNATRLHLVADAGSKLDWRVLNPVTGDVQTHEFRDCTADDCRGFAIAAGANAGLRAVVATPYSIAGSVVVVSGSAASTKLAKINQHALAGAWWAPYARGQGFMLDFLPATNTFFMPWFTFSAEGDVDPAAQRWYTVQGTVADGPTTAQVPIYDSRSGAFDASDATSVNHVGDATMQFADCDHASLHYKFLAPYNNAKEGDITLSRLLPRREACTLADCTPVPPTATTAPQGGFDSKLSGSWYEPATAGQGLQIDVQPGGILFAAWFTYDPAALGDDETKQHWMTLQGSLADAHNGVASVAIAQAIGGSFDSQPTDDQYAMGSATLSMIDCSHIKLDYHFDDNDKADAYRNRSGSIDLQKIGGCTP